MTSESRHDRSSGFTLLELTAAMAVLVFGLTSLIGVLGLGISQRRGAEMRSRAVLLVDAVMHRIETDILAEHPLPEQVDSEDQLEEQLAIARVEAREIDGYPGIKYSIEFAVDPELPELVLTHIRVSWLEQGEDRAEEFWRVLPREVPFSQRVAQHRRQ